MWPSCWKILVIQHNWTRSVKNSWGTQTLTLVCVHRSLWSQEPPGYRIPQSWIKEPAEDSYLRSIWACLGEHCISRVALNKLPSQTAPPLLHISLNKLQVKFPRSYLDKGGIPGFGIITWVGPPCGSLLHILTSYKKHVPLYFKTHVQLHLH